MKKIYKRLIAPVILLVLMTSCNKYLDIQPKGKQLLQKVTDYDQWLNSPALTYEVDITNLDEFTDLIDNAFIVTSSTASTDLMYQWAPQFNDPPTTPPLWTSFYGSIYYFNTVIDNIDAATDGTDQQKQSLKAEALLGRAYEYLYLVNLYGKVYNATTAAADLAAPYVTAADVNVKTPQRSSVKDMYAHIIADLNAAIPNLPADNSGNRYRGSVAAANSILARTYYYMADYANAQKYALLALQAPSLGMIDYTTGGVTGPTTNPVLPRLAIRKDVIYGRETAPFVGNNPTSLAPTPTLAFLNSFDRNDARFNLFKNTYGTTLSANPTRGNFIFFEAIIGNTYQQNAGTTVAEMKLIIAESAARSGDLTTALQQLNDLRKYRIMPASYVQIQSNDQTVVLQKIQAERIFEFPFTGLRWFDMRMLNSRGEMPIVTRYDQGNNPYATLQPNSPRYVLQIPSNILLYNPDWPQNP